MMETEVRVPQDGDHLAGCMQLQKRVAIFFRFKRSREELKMLTKGPTRNFRGSQGFRQARLLQ
jgi:hypothetical protein